MSTSGSTPGEEIHRGERDAGQEYATEEDTRRLTAQRDCREVQSVVVGTMSKGCVWKSGHLMGSVRCSSLDDVWNHLHFGGAV